MKAYQHILLTTDFSKFSEEVAKKAISLAGHFNAGITLLHVIEHFPEEGADTAAWVIAQNRRRLEAFAQSIPSARMIPMVRFSVKSVEDEIINVAREIKANLIIVGAYGENGVSILPSLNAKSIRDNAPCDVLIVHAESA